MVADGGCQRDVVHRMNEGHKALGAPKSGQRGGLGINARMYE